MTLEALELRRVEPERRRAPRRELAEVADVSTSSVAGDVDGVGALDVLGALVRRSVTALDARSDGSSASRLLQPVPNARNGAPLAALLGGLAGSAVLLELAGLEATS